MKSPLSCIHSFNVPPVFRSIPNNDIGRGLQKLFLLRNDFTIGVDYLLAKPFLQVGEKKIVTGGGEEGASRNPFNKILPYRLRTGAPLHCFGRRALST